MAPPQAGGGGTTGGPKVGIVTVTFEPAALRTWLLYHLHLGVEHFFLQIEGTDWAEQIVRSEEPFRERVTFWRSPNDPDKTLTNNYYSLQTRQIAAMEHALFLARERQGGKGSVDWLLHIDDDELFYIPDFPKTQLGAVFANVPAAKSSVSFPNREAVYTTADTQNCFVQARSFRRNATTPDMTSYINGKSAARVADATVHPIGPHAFAAPGDAKLEYLVSAEAPRAMILHYESCPFDRWEKKFWNMRDTPAADLAKIPFVFYRESIKRMQLCAGAWGGKGPLFPVGVVPAGVCDVNSLRSFYARYKTEASMRGLKASDQALVPVMIDWHAALGGWFSELANGEGHGDAGPKAIKAMATPPAVAAAGAAAQAQQQPPSPALQQPVPTAGPPPVSSVMAAAPLSPTTTQLAFSVGTTAPISQFVASTTAAPPVAFAAPQPSLTLGFGSGAAAAAGSAAASIGRAPTNLPWPQNPDPQAW